jgi:tetratricopeptide (TPR) repeat protein
VVAAELAAIRTAQADPSAGIEEIRRAGLDLTQPVNGPALQSLVELLVADGKPREALDAVQAALAAHPHEALFHELRGRALRSSGQPGPAREALARALELEPERAAALAELAALTAEQGDPQSALALYDRAGRADPEVVAYPWAAIQLVATTEDTAELERRLEALLARHGTHSAATDLLAQRLLTRDPERARELERRAARFRRGQGVVDARIEPERAGAARSAD